MIDHDKNYYCITSILQHYFTAILNLYLYIFRLMVQYKLDKCCQIIKKMRVPKTSYSRRCTCAFRFPLLNIYLIIISESEYKIMYTYYKESSIEYPFELVLPGTGLGLAYLACVTVAADYFDRWRGVAIGIVTSGAGLGTFIYPFLIDAMTEIYGWRGSLMILSGLSLNLCVCGALQFPTPATEIEYDQGQFCSIISIPMSNQKSTDMYNSESKRMKALFSIPSFVILCISCILMSFGFSVFSTHMPAFAVNIVQLSATEMASLVSVTGISNMVFRLLIGGLLTIPRVDPQIVCMLCYALMGVDIACIPFAYNYTSMMATSTVFGMTFACYGPVLCSLAIKYVGMELYTSSYGYITISCGVGILLGAPAAGKKYIHKDIHASICI